MATILLILFYNPQTKSMTINFETRSACIDAKRELINSNINAKMFCFAKKIQGFCELK